MLLACHQKGEKIMARYEQGNSTYTKGSNRGNNKEASSMFFSTKIIASRRQSS
jgi:hypothetical protein